ncbi:hypothetical protein MAFF211479_49880 (plasmid) [Ralstonia solanacearum]|nr:hypothetical protein ACH51_18310 [Ralstonia solanacearum]BCL95286.1 hypothetical protein MAFF211479_49880 [Ralstonia solanacearum]BCM00390.1 hypothetical protein MAFF211491_48430 [Ralstonia solanacearum]BCM15822.1 hypothetical protein MAFF241648_50120 [Ralstonia solanacearum]BCN07853.1 hypothetical protein RPSB_49900 [Ralstonia solanacearum]
MRWRRGGIDRAIATRGGEHLVQIARQPQAAQAQLLVEDGEHGAVVAIVERAVRGDEAGIPDLCGHGMRPDCPVGGRAAHGCAPDQRRRAACRQYPQTCISSIE